jgi:hypothetical protein
MGNDLESAQPSPVADVVNFRSIPLPSRGVWYRNADGSDALPGGVIYVRPTRSDEAIALDAPGVTIEEKTDRTLAACLRFPEGSTLTRNDLTLTDQFYAMLAVSMVTYGMSFRFTYNCVACRHENSTKVDVSSDVQEITPDVLRKRHGEDLTFTEPFEATLPISGAKVGLRMLRVRDEAAIAARLRSPLAPRGDGAMKLVRISHAIDSVNGVTCRDSDRDLFFRNVAVHSRDLRAVEAAIEKRTTTIRTDVERACEACGRRQGVAIPFDMDFFRGTADFE